MKWWAMIKEVNQTPRERAEAVLYLLLLVVGVALLLGMVAALGWMMACRCVPFDIPEWIAAPVVGLAAAMGLSPSRGRKP